MKYHLDHPQLKRKKSLGNGETPKAKESSCQDMVDKHEQVFHKEEKPKKK